MNISNKVKEVNERNERIKTMLSREDFKRLQSISIKLKGLCFAAENGKKIIENYLFVDCGEKLDINVVLHETYNNYLSINENELEELSNTIDSICFPNGIDYNSEIFDDLEIDENGTDMLAKTSKEKKEKKSYRLHPYNRYNNENSKNKTPQERDIYKLMGHLTMNPRKEPFLG